MQQTIHLKNHQQQNRPQRQGNGFRAKPKYEGKGHDALLRKMIEDKALTVIETISGAKFTGRIVTADKYTITIEHTFNGVTQKLTIFKHGIELFYATEA
jgi:sRNA-binding regulator protein Hfq